MRGVAELTSFHSCMSVSLPYSVRLHGRLIFKFIIINIIPLCTVIQHSKQGYEELKEFCFFKLLSGRQLRYIKNKVKQTPGFHKDMLTWMVQAANANKVTNVG